MGGLGGAGRIPELIEPRDGRKVGSGWPLKITEPWDRRMVGLEGTPSPTPAVCQLPLSSSASQSPLQEWGAPSSGWQCCITSDPNPPSVHLKPFPLSCHSYTVTLLLFLSPL